MGTGADNTATFALELEADEKPAEDMAGALDKLKKRLQDGTEELRAMQQALRRLQGGSSVNVQAFKQLRDKIDAQKASIASAQERYIKLGGSFSELAKASDKGAKEAIERNNAMFDAIRAGSGTVGGYVGQARAFARTIGKAGMAGAALAAAVAVVALTAALIAGTGALARYGVAQADAARSELLQLEGLTKIRSWYGIAAGSATELQQSINDVSASVAIGRDRVAAYAQQLYTMGLRGANLRAALEGTAIKASTQGEQYASAFAGMAAGAALAGYSVQKLADNVKARLGGIAAKQMLSLDVQSMKLHEGISAIFRDLKIEGFLDALNRVTQLFTQNTESGKALKFLAESIFNPLIAGAEKALPFAKRFFQGMIIGALEVQGDLLSIAVTAVHVGHGIRDALHLNGVVQNFDGMRLALELGAHAAKVLIVAIGLIAGAALAVTTVVGTLFYGLVIAPIQLAAEAILFLWGAFKSGLDFLKKVDATTIGHAIIQGIIEGITGGAGLLVDAIKGLGKLAVDSFKNVMGIHSPAAVMKPLGRALPAGVESGVDEGAPAVDRAVMSMVAIPQMATIAASAPFAVGIPSASGSDPSKGTAAAAAGPRIEIHELHYHSSGRENHRADAEDFADKLLRELLGIGTHMGAAP